jgi:hypothetical protein
MNKGRIAGIDSTVPNSARIWNYWLGGQDNYPVDRAAGERYRTIYPGIVANARAYRRFLARTVRHLAKDEGIRQFLDIGTGLPNAENTHEIVQAIAPASRIVYVDNDPLVVTYARALLTSAPEGVTDYIEADVRAPEKIIETATGILDFAKPIAIILSGVLGHIADEEAPHSLVSRLVDSLPVGSHLILQDSTTLNEASTAALRSYNRSGAVPYHLRDPEQITRFFDGLALLDPGVVPIQFWRPESAHADAADLNGFGGVGRKA